jgi:hypothetical protein
MIPRSTRLRDNTSAFWDFYVKQDTSLCHFGLFACWKWVRETLPNLAKAFREFNNRSCNTQAYRAYLL